MSIRGKILLMAIATVVVAMSGKFSTAQDGEKEVIKVRGSDSMAALIDSYAKDFMKNHPNVNIIVSGGQDVPFGALLNKEAQIIMASSEIHQQEIEGAARKGADIQGKVVGWGGIVIVLNPQNPINELTVEQVRKVFSGQVTNWKDVGGPDETVSVLTVGEQRGGTLDFVRNDFLRAPFAPNAVTKMYFRSVSPTFPMLQPPRASFELGTSSNSHHKGWRRRLKW